MRPVGVPATREIRGITWSARIVSTSARPAASRPTAPISVDSAPSRASQRAVFVADPPGQERDAARHVRADLERPDRGQDDVDA